MSHAEKLRIDELVARLGARDGELASRTERPRDMPTSRHASRRPELPERRQQAYGGGNLVLQWVAREDERQASEGVDDGGDNGPWVSSK